MQKHQQQRHATVTIVLALATLGDMTQIEMILSVLRCTRWPRQILSLSQLLTFFAKKLRQCKHTLKCFKFAQQPLAKARDQQRSLTMN
jgi:hypothetical protein